MPDARLYLVGRLGLGSIGLAMGSCDYNEYPLEPSFCDDWCRTMRRAGCDQEPENCVRDCEISLPSEDCLQRQEELRQCYEAAPPELFACVGRGLQASVRPEPSLCRSQRDALIGCEAPAVLQCIEQCRAHELSVQARFESTGGGDSQNASCPALPLPCNRLCWELNGQLGPQDQSGPLTTLQDGFSALLSCATDRALECRDAPRESTSIEAAPGPWFPVFLQCALAP